MDIRMSPAFPKNYVRAAVGEVSTMATGDAYTALNVRAFHMMRWGQL